MRYNFDNLETFIHRIRPVYVLKHLPEEYVFNRELGYLETEISEIRRNLRDQIFDVDDFKLVETHVQYYQNTFTHLLEIVAIYKRQIEHDDYRHLNGTVVSLVSFYSAVINHIEGIITYIINRFDRYIDVDAPASHSYCNDMAADFKRQLEDLDKAYEGTEIDEGLLSIAKQPFVEFITSPGKTSYRRIEFLKILLATLQQGSKTDSINATHRDKVIASQLEDVRIPETEINVRLHLQLLSINFNCPDYVHYSTTKLWQKMEGTGDDALKGKILRLYLKLMKQIGFNMLIAFEPKSQAATKQIADWIEDELEYLQSEARTYTAFANSGIDAERLVPMKQISTTFSMAELLLFIKVFAEAGIFVVVQPFDVLKKVSSFFTTVGTDKLNPNTLRGRYWNKPKPATIESLMEKLRKCMELLRSWRGG